MPLSSIPRVTRPREVRMKPARRGTFVTFVLCVMLAAYIGFIAYSLLTQETAIERQTAVEASTQVAAAEDSSLAAPAP